MNILERMVVGTCRTVLWISTLVIFVILVCNTALRYATGASLQWANEVPELLFPWLVMSGVVLAAAHGAHITTTFLVETLPAGIQRVVATLSWLIVAGLYATLAWATANMLEIVHDERSQILNIPGSVTYACVMVGMAMLSLLALQSAARAWLAGDPQRAADGDAPARPVAGAHW
ncbi:TRAP transporter small permease [Paracidovorax konjaci]|uniref:TRAP transporter small permease protein n=1 Tax=Paracidovorax konjaci TaxID=32040 RepID=A0A1I1WNH8_9BURK|nr:TRAP transporter small permease [Paracidovorax konjaci]SFD96676.1 TRAP-type C4-dicarboxylate transport system, small permease component [Paracidovorax konjaci]